MKDFQSVGKTVEGNEGSKCNYPTRLDTYGCGCQHDCKYCYAKSLLDFRKNWNAERPSVASASEISKAIRKIKRGEVVRLGGMTDCFMPMEKDYRSTYKAIKLLNRRKVPYLIVTKSAMVADDEYIEILDKELAHIQVTITTLDDKLSATYEKASPPSERVQAIEKLFSYGYDISVRLSPFVPENVDFEALSRIKCDKILIEFLRVNSWVKKWWDIDFSEYTVHQNGYNHLPLQKKKEYISMVKGFKQMTVCEDEDEAYEYWKNNFNFNKEDYCNLRRR